MKQMLSPAKLQSLLAAHYGAIEPAPTKDPFELVLWENVAYLAPPAKRLEAFTQLKRRVGTTPRRLLDASKKDLESVTAKGILKSTFAEKLRDCAAILQQEFDGSLDAAMRGPLAGARRALRRFPGIGEPGAEKILLLAGVHPYLAPDSNALRVLVRTGLIAEDASYAKMYKASREVEAALPAQVTSMQQAHLLLQRHGQQLCKRSAPRCAACPVLKYCPGAQQG